VTCIVPGKHSSACWVCMEIIKEDLVCCEISLMKCRYAAFNPAVGLSRTPLFDTWLEYTMWLSYSVSIS
jgi:hypothetical protein